MMVSEGDCAFTSATPTPSFYRSGQRRLGAPRGQSPLPNPGQHIPIAPALGQLWPIYVQYL
jgi:hypothetical protein